MAYGKCAVLLLLAAVGIAAATAALSPAAGQSPGRQEEVAVRAAAESGHIDLEKSRVYVFVDKTGLGHEHAVEGKIKSGEIQLGAAADAGTIEFDMTSFAADTEPARKYLGLKGSVSASTQQQVNRNMLGADVLNVRRHPTATFAIDSALPKKTKQGGAVYELKGHFTLHGKTRPLTIQARPSKKNGTVQLRGEFTILQTEYGITPYTAALGTIGVADRLRICGDLRVADEEAGQQ
jgi:polyisoprenoid-binding protein YceI